MVYKIRRGRRMGVYAAISYADRYEGPICTSICTTGGALGAREAETPVTTNSKKYFVVNRTNYTTDL